MSTEIQERLFGAPVLDHVWRPPASLPNLAGFQHLGFDTEDTGKNPFKDKPIGVSICVPTVWEEPKSWRRYYLPYGHKGGGNLDEQVVRRWIKTELAGKDLYGLNMKFDAQTCHNASIMLEEYGCKLHDVAFPPALLNENRRKGFSLKAFAQEYLPPEDEQKVLPETIAAHEFFLAHAGEVAHRAETDAYIALRLKQVTDPLIDAEGLRRVLDLEDSIIYVVAEMERNGCRLDRPKLEIWRRAVRQKFERMILDIWSATKLRVSPDSSLDMQKLFAHLQIPCPMVHEDPSNEESELRPCFEEELLKKIKHPVVQQVLLARKLKSLDTKFLSKYLKVLDNHDVIRYQLHQLRGDEGGTVMGRFSSAAPSSGGMNCQQVPKVDKQISDNFVPDWIIRELFIPDEGYDWGKADASQIEYRILAHYAENKEVLKRYHDDPNVSFHRLVESMIHRVKPDYPYWAVKNFNFMRVYGGGRDKAAIMLETTRDVSDPLYDLYDEILPEAGRLLNRAAEIAKKRGYVKTFLGRRRRYPDGQRCHSALHSVISGTAADINKIKLREVYNNRKDLGIHKMRLTVHDEMDADLDRGPQRVEKWKEFLDDQSITLRVPILWEVKAGSNWACREGKVD